jgi:hypothetical protein
MNSRGQNARGDQRANHTMPLIVRTLIIIQTLAVELAALAAMAAVETTQVSGPILSASGLIVAYLAFRRNRPCGLCLGLATPTSYVLCFSLISGLGWSADDARMPMFLIVAAIAAFHVVAAFFALDELATSQADHRPKLPFQFSILSLLVLMLLVSVFLASYKTFGPPGAAIGALFSYAVILAYLLRQFLLMRLRQEEEIREKGWRSSSRETPIADNREASGQLPTSYATRGGDGQHRDS